MSWTLINPPDAILFSTKRAMKNKARIIRIIWDKEGEWQAIDDLPRTVDDSDVFHLQHLLEIHPELLDVLEAIEKRGMGHEAIIDKAGSWQVQKFKRML